MEKQILETVQLINKVNKFLDYKDFDFDFEDVMETIKGSRERLSKFIDEFDKVNLDDKNEIKALMIYIELEYSNFVWAFQEMRDFIDRAFLKYSD